MQNRRRSTVALIVCYLAYTSIYIARMNLSMASPALSEMHYLSASELGMLGSVFSIVYALGRLLGGAVSDTQPPYRMIASGLFLAGIGNLLFGLFPPFVGALLLWGLNALAQSMLWSSVLIVAAFDTDRKTASKRASVMVTSVATGNILGILLNLYFIDRFGVRFAFLIPGAITLLLSLAVLLTTRYVPAKVAEKNAAGAGNVFVRMGRLLSDRALRTALVPAAFHGVMKDNVTIWMALFFVERYGIDISSFAGQLLLIPVAGLVGRVLHPFVNRALDYREHRVSQVGFVIALLSSALILPHGIPPIVAMVCLAAVYAAVSLANTSFLSIYPMRFPENVASVSGLMDFTTYLGAGIASVVYGFVIEKAGYDVMFVSWIVLSAASVLILECVIRMQKNDEV